MKNKISWKEKYILSLKENLTLKDIMLLRDVNQKVASDIRNKAIHYCISNDIQLYSKAVPSEAVLIVTKKDINYYYNKMILESKAIIEVSNNVSA